MIGFGAEAGTRTPTPLRALDPETGQPGFSPSYVVSPHPSLLASSQGTDSVIGGRPTPKKSATIF